MMSSSESSGDGVKGGNVSSKVLRNDFVSIPTVSSNERVVTSGILREVYVIMLEKRRHSGASGRRKFGSFSLVH